MKLRNWLIPVVLLLLTACGGVVNEPAGSQKSAPAVEIATDTPVPTPTEASEARPTPTETAAPEVSQEPADASVVGEAETAAGAEMAEPVEPAEEAPTEEAATPAEEPAATEEPKAAEAVEVNWLTVEGKTEAGFAYLGNPEAPITVMDYSDFMWGACRSYVVGTEPELKENYVKTGQVKLVFVPMLDHGDFSIQSHQAAECAGEQGKFWPMHDALFENQGSLWGNVQQGVKALAAELGLDQQQFNSCLDEQRFLELVQSQDAYRRELGIRTRPTLDINGQFVVGAQPFAAFQAVIEPMLVQ